MLRDHDNPYAVGFAGPFGSQIRRSPDGVDGGGDGAGDEGGETPDPTEERLARLEQNQQVAELLSDPDIRAVIENKRAGKTIRIVEATEDENPEDTDEDPDPIDSLPDEDPKKELLKAVADLIDRRAGRTLKEIDNRLRSVEGFATTNQAKEIKNDIAAARTKYADFDQYSKKMVELAKTHDKLGVEELYVLAKMKAGKLELTKSSTFSEKPSSQPRNRREVNKSSSKNKPTHGRRAFNEMLGEALSGLDLNTLGED